MNLRGMGARVATETSGRVMILAATTLVASTTPAAAYLDPGTGTMVLQAVFGAVVGAFITARIYWNKIKRFFKSKSGGGDGEFDTAEQRTDKSRPS